MRISMRGAAALVLMLLAAMSATAGEVTVYAAASLSNAIQDVTKIWQASSGHTAKTSFAASSTLARQIESGAPAGVFISADEEWMDYLEQRNLIVAGSRTRLLGNRLVLVTPGTARRRSTSSQASTWPACSARVASPRETRRMCRWASTPRRH